jgi:lipopolysaccharide export LptBFGC system permease protein LptF
VPTIRNVLAAVVAAVALVLMTVPAAAADEAAPQLSVTLTSDGKTVTSGDTVTYKGEVKNLGTSDTDVKIVLNAPKYVELGIAAHATVEKNDATWTTTIPAGKASGFTIKATIGTIPHTERRVTTLASVYVGDDASPVVRTADASFIKGVADGPGSTTATKADTSGAFPWHVLWAIASCVIVLLAIAAILFFVLRNKRRGREPRRSTYAE